MAKKHHQAPTPKQKNAAKRLIENGGKRKPDPVGKVLRDAGYSDAISKNPHKVTRSKGFRALLDKYLPEKDVARAHQELMHAAVIQQYVFPLNADDTLIKLCVESASGCKLIHIQSSTTQRRAYFQSPDNRSRKDAIDMAYKLRGNYEPVKVEETGVISVTFKRNGNTNKLGAATKAT